MKTSKSKTGRRTRHRLHGVVRTRTKLKDLVEAAQAAGAKVSVSLEPKQMPMRFPSDPPDVKLLIDESERMSKLGNNWLTADVPNQVAAEMCLRHGWAFSLAAAWLRCKLKGELLPESEKRPNDKLTDGGCVK
jgi:hypothetical protein